MVALVYYGILNPLQKVNIYIGCVECYAYNDLDHFDYVYRINALSGDRKTEVVAYIRLPKDPGPCTFESRKGN